MSAKKKLTRTLNVRLTEAEWQAFQELKKSGRTISDLIRRSIDFYQFYSKPDSSQDHKPESLPTSQN